MLRGPRPAPGWDGLRQAIDARTRGDHPTLKEDAAAKLARIVGALERATAPMAGWTEKLPPVERLRAVVAAAEALAATDDERGVQRLWRDQAGEALSDFVHDALQSFAGLPAVAAEDFTALMLELLSGVAVRPRYGKHPRLAIWGPLEARLQQADLLVLGSLNEGTWPAESAIDPWLNRPMRQGFGLPAPERKIGLTRARFPAGDGRAQGAADPRRARRRRADGAVALAAEARRVPHLRGRRAAVERRRARAAAGARDRSASQGRARRAADAAARRGAAASAAVGHADRGVAAQSLCDLCAAHPAPQERWIRLDQDPNAPELGIAVHSALHEFTRKFPHALPTDALALLRAEGDAAFQPYLDRPNVWAFWQPRFQRIAAWWLGVERERRPLLNAIATEIAGELVLPDVAPLFTLTARADRIDTMRDGALAIIDYKTGQPPEQNNIALGFAPQLALEATMALAGGFPGIAASLVAELAHWQLSGNRNGGADKPVAGDPMALAAEARAGLIELVREFSSDNAAYAATPDPQLRSQHTTTTRTWRATPNG